MTDMETAVDLIKFTPLDVVRKAFLKLAGPLLPEWKRLARGLTLALLVVGLSTLGGGGFTGEVNALPLGMPVPEAYFNQGLIPPDVPAEVLIGEPFKFTVRFKNNGNDIGFAPFVDLVIDSRGADYNTGTPAGPCDGIDFVSAEMVAVFGGPLALTSPTSWNAASCASGSLSGTPTHPYAGVGPVTLPASGWQLVTMALPFGSFDPTQPEIVVEVTAMVHDFADVNPPYPLKIYTRGGFRLTTATGGPPILEHGNDVIADGWDWVEVTPNVIKIKKEYSGPENETATGPNFTHSYKITVDIADGQSMGKPLTVTDCLPNSAAYEGGLVVIAPPSWPALGTPTEPPIGTVNNPPVSCPVVSWPNAFVVGVPGPDATVEFQFSIRDIDADGNELLPDCKPVIVANGLTVTGKWTPKDPRDLPGGTVTVSNPNAHELSAKCMAIQKSVIVHQEFPGGGAGPSPGDILQYTLNFQISDYKTIGQQIRITDQLSDGQLFLNSPAPELTIGDQFPASVYSLNPLSSTHYGVSVNPNSQVPKCPVKGTTDLVFDVSGALSAAATPAGHLRHQAGILTGGLATGSSLQAPAVGTLVFYAEIQDGFSYAQSPGD